MRETADPGPVSMPEDAASAFGGMTDLAEILRGPDGAEQAERIAERFDAIEQELVREMAQGVSPDRFRAMETIRNAVFRAKHVVLAFRKA